MRDGRMGGSDLSGNMDGGGGYDNEVEGVKKKNM